MKEMKEMKGLLIYDDHRAERNKEFINILLTESEKIGLNLTFVLIKNLLMGTSDENGLFCKNIINGEDIKNFDFAIVRTQSPFLSRHLELLGLRVFNNSLVSQICNNKSLTCQYLSSKGISVVESLFFSDENKRYAGFSNKKTIIKTVDGHGGKQVFLAENNEQFETAIEKTKKSDIIIQPFIGEKARDLRVYVLGNKILASVLRESENSFKANFSLGATPVLYNLSEKEEKLVKKIISFFNFDLVGIDFLFDNGELKLNEIEDIVGSRMLYSVSDLSIGRLYIEYIFNC